MEIMYFVQGFFEVYTIGAAFILIFLIGQIIYMMHRVDKDLLKAKLFLNEGVMQKTWMYISVAGAAFALNALVKFATMTDWGAVLGQVHLYDLTLLVFLVAFILAVYNWYVFVGSFVRR